MGNQTYHRKDNVVCVSTKKKAALSYCFKSTNQKTNTTNLHYIFR